MGYDIIIVAGQSNAFGYGWGETQYPFAEDSRIMHLIDTYPMKMIREEGKPSQLDMPFPPTLKFEEGKEVYAYDRYNGNFGNYFAAEYVKSGLLKEGRKLLLVKAAVGGTGFARKHWTIGGRCYNKMVYMVDEALKLAGEDSRIVAFLWHQGEHDVFENGPTDTYRSQKYDCDWDYARRRSDYYNNLKAFFLDVRKRYGEDLPIIAGEFVKEWIETLKEDCDAILSAAKDVIYEIGKAEFVSSEGLMSNGRKNGTGDILHFSKEALALFGKRYFEAYKEIKNN